MKPKVFITLELPLQALDRILPACDMEVWQDELPPPRDLLISKVRDLDGLLSLLTDKIDAALMDNAPKSKVVSNWRSVSITLTFQRRRSAGSRWAIRRGC